MWHVPGVCAGLIGECGNERGRCVKAMQAWWGVQAAEGEVGGGRGEEGLAVAACTRQLCKVCSCC